MRTFRDPEHGSKSVPYGPQVKKTPPLYSGGLGRGQEAIPTAGGPVEPPVESTPLPEGYDVFVRFTQYFSSLTYQGDVPGDGEPSNWTEIQALGNPIIFASNIANSYENFLQIGDNGDIILNTESIWAQGLVALGYYTPGQNIATEEFASTGGLYAGYITPVTVFQALYSQGSGNSFSNGIDYQTSLLSDILELPQFSFLTEGEFGSTNAQSLASAALWPNQELNVFLDVPTPFWQLQYPFYSLPYAEFLPFIDEAWIAQLQQYYEENDLDPTQIWDPSTGADVQFENYFGGEWVYIPDTGPVATELPAGYQDVMDFLRPVIEGNLFLTILPDSGVSYTGVNNQHVVVYNPDGTYSLNPLSYAAQLLVATGQYAPDHVFPAGTFSFNSGIPPIQFLVDLDIVPFTEALTAVNWWANLEDNLEPDVEAALSYWDVDGDGDLQLFTDAGSPYSGDAALYFLANDGIGNADPATVATILNNFGFSFVDTAWVEQMIAYYTENGWSNFSWYDAISGTAIAEGYSGGAGWLYEPPPPVTPEQFNGSLIAWVLQGNNPDTNGDGVVGSGDLIELLTQMSDALKIEIFGEDFLLLTVSQQSELFGQFVNLYTSGFTDPDGVFVTWDVWGAYITDPDGFGVGSYSEFADFYTNYGSTGASFADYQAYLDAGYTVPFDEYLMYLAWEGSSTASALTPPAGTDLPTQQLSDWLSVVWANGQDINGDGVLDTDDKNILLTQVINAIGTGDMAFDLDNSGAVDANDYLLANSAFAMYNGNATQPALNVTAFSNQNGWWNADGEWISFEGAVFGPYAGSSAEILAGDYTYMLEGEYDPSFLFAWTFLNENFSPMAQADYDSLLAWWNSLTPTFQQLASAQIIDNPMGDAVQAVEWAGLFDFTGDGIVDDNELAMAFYLLYGNPIAYNDWQGNEQFLVEQPAGSPPPTGEAPPPPTGESAPPPPTASMGGGEPDYPYYLTFDQMYDNDVLQANWPPTEAPEWYQNFWGLIEPWFTTYDLDWDQSGGMGTPGGPLALGSPDFNSWWSSVSEALGIDVSLGEVMGNPTPGDNSYLPFEPVENPPAWADVVADGVFDLADVGTLGLMYSPYFSIVSAFQNHPDSEFYNPTGVFAGASPAFQAMQQMWFDMGLTAENLWEVIYLDEGWGFYDPEMLMTAINEYGLGESLDDPYGWQSAYYVYNNGDEGLPSLLNPDATYNGFYANLDPFNLGVGGWEQVSQGYNISNFLDFLASFGGSEELGYDLNEDGFIGTDDLLAFLAGYSTGNVWQPSEISPDISGSIYDSAEYTVDEDPVVTEEQTYERGGLILKKKR